MNTSKVIIEKISFIDSEKVTKNMHEKGYALVPRFLPGQYCKELTVNMTAPISSQDLEPDDDYTGGEFVLTQQIPRAQSKAIVLRPRRGIC